MGAGTLQAGGLRFGPDVEHVQHIDYTVSVGLAAKGSPPIF